MRNGASDKLYNSQDKLSFEEVIALYRRQIYEEYELTGDLELDIDLPCLFKIMEDAADITEQIIAKHMQLLYAELQNHENEHVSGLGKALESGDYSTIAI